ncbi:DUF4920 domain-containing protein [Mucilaginibacter sp. PAMB04168]|uniref:DUF4920 domain-containing protein n=1 Tax=Mucilaginibacter sp. PAMB04168 TaxID=3138567 RepID=UPI0031F602B1
MRYVVYSLFILLITSLNVNGQNRTPLPHGMVFGNKPSTVSLMPASELESFMGKRTRTSAAIIGKVVKVTHEKGGWFTLDAGNGRTISARFRNYKVVLPSAIKGREVIISGIATKQFIADDQQQLAGDTVVGKKQHNVKTDPKRRLLFEVYGLMVNK